MLADTWRARSDVVVRFVVVSMLLASHADAGVPPVDGADAGVPRVMRTTMLGPGNQLRPRPPLGPRSVFKELCLRVAAGCAFNRAVWETTAFMVYELVPDGEMRVVTATEHTRVPDDPFHQCVHQGLVGKQLPAKDTGERMACSTMETPDSHFDSQAFAAQVGACLGRETPIEKVEVSFAQVVKDRTVTLTDLVITGSPRLDLETETCVRRAASVPDFEFTEDDRPPFSRREQRLEVRAWSKDAKPFELPEKVKERLKRR